MKIQPFIWFATSVLVFLPNSLSNLKPVVAEQSALIGISEDKATTTARAHEIVNEPLVLRKELEKVCLCESGNHQFNEDGSVHRGVINHHDIGLCQINSDYHEAAAKKLGFDIYTRDGNIAYANHLYDTQGLTPWNWSRACWINK